MYDDLLLLHINELIIFINLHSECCLQIKYLNFTWWNSNNLTKSSSKSIESHKSTLKATAMNRSLDPNIWYLINNFHCMNLKSNKVKIILFSNYSLEFFHDYLKLIFKFWRRLRMLSRLQTLTSNFHVSNKTIAIWFFIISRGMLCNLIQIIFRMDQDYSLEINIMFNILYQIWLLLPICVKYLL